MKTNLTGMEALVGCLAMIVVMVLWAFVMALPTMWLWNWLMPMLFGLKTLTWVEALGVNLLCGFLFKGSYNVNKQNS